MIHHRLRHGLAEGREQLSRSSARRPSCLKTVAGHRLVPCESCRRGHIPGSANFTSAAFTLDRRAHMISRGARRGRADKSVARQGQRPPTRGCASHFSRVGHHREQGRRHSGLRGPFISSGVSRPPGPNPSAASPSDWSGRRPLEPGTRRKTRVLSSVRPARGATNASSRRAFPGVPQIVGVERQATHHHTTTSKRAPPRSRRHLGFTLAPVLEHASGTVGSTRESPKAPERLVVLFVSVSRVGEISGDSCELSVAS